MDTPATPAKNPTAKTAAKLSKTANGVADKADDKISEIARRAETAARRAEMVLHEGVDTLRTQTRAYADQAVERIEQAQAMVSERVREKPITGILAAAGVGLLVGMLIGGRRH